MPELVYTPAKLLALWPDKPLPKDLRQHMVRRGNVTRITKVAAPLIEIYPAPKKTAKLVKCAKTATPEKPTPAIMVCPGGGFGGVADLTGGDIQIHEGTKG